MPVYVYRCEECGQEFEVQQRITADPLTECQLCGASGVQRLLSPGAGVIFKGSGFYETDYKRNGSNGDGAGKDKKVAKTSSESSSSSSSESSPAAGSTAPASASSSSSDSSSSSSKSGD